MLRLIYRDLFIYQKRNLVVLPGFALLFVFFSQEFGYAGMGLTMIMISVYALVMTAYTSFAYDETNKFNRFLRSAPIPSSTIILSRYASCVFSSIMGVVYVVIFSALANVAAVYNPALRRDMTMSMEVLLVWITMIAFVSAFLMPILFKFGYVKTKYPLMLLVIAVPASGPMILAAPNMNQGLTAALSVISGKNGYILIFILSLLAFLGSAALSITIFKRKEEL